MDPFEAREAQVYRLQDRVHAINAPVEDLYKGYSPALYRANDTASPLLPGLELVGGHDRVQTKTNNGRTLTFENDGYPHYRVTNKDSKGLYDITNDYLTTRNNGRKPSAQEVKDFARKIADANGIKDINNIRVGTDLRIPDKLQHAQRVPGRVPEIAGREPDREVKIGESPSKSFKDATELDIYRRKEDTTVNRDGTITKTFNGAARDGVLGLDRTQVHGHEITDRNGKLLATEVNMTSSKSFTVPKADGGTEEVTANKMRVTYNADGSYSTVLTTEDGTKVAFRTNKDGTKQRM